MQSTCQTDLEISRCGTKTCMCLYRIQEATFVYKKPSVLYYLFCGIETDRLAFVQKLALGFPDTVAGSPIVLLWTTFGRY